MDDDYTVIVIIHTAKRSKTIEIGDFKIVGVGIKQTNDVDFS